MVKKYIIRVIEIMVLSVFGVVVLLEFIGIATISLLVPRESLMQFNLIGLDFGGLEFTINQGVFNIIGFMGGFVFIYFIFIRESIFKKGKK